MSDIILEAKHLKKIFGFGVKSFTAVEDVSFSLEKGKCLGIVGESGSGKSTIAKMLTRLINPTSGSIELFGKDVTFVKGKELREMYRHIQMVFQMPVESFDPHAVLGDGIGESLRNYGMSRKNARGKTEELLKLCGLEPEYAKRYPHEVSGGQCQRAAIARALAVEPEILILDEATSALDVTVQKQIMELLMKLKQEKHLSFFMISHDLALIQAFCDEVLVLYQGNIVEQGTPDEIMHSPKTEYTKMLIRSVISDGR